MVDLVDHISSISDEDAAEIRSSIEFAREDITDEVTSLGARPWGNKIIWQKAAYSQAMENHLRTKAYASATGITQIMSRFKRMKSRVEHGVEDGFKIDWRRVGRAFYGNGRVFQKRSIIDNLDMSLTILMDSSGSIRDDDWNLMLQVATAFVQALVSRDDIELIVMSYTSSKDTTIARHYDKRLGKFHATRPGQGGTPSGVALAAIRDTIYGRLGTRRRDKVIIHLTDGMPDDNDEVKRQVELNRAQHIETYCILVGGSSSYYDATFKDIYGAKYQSLDNFGQLMKCLTDLFGSMVEVR